MKKKIEKKNEKVRTMKDEKINEKTKEEKYKRKWGKNEINKCGKINKLIRNESFKNTRKCRRQHNIFN